MVEPNDKVHNNKILAKTNTSKLWKTPKRLLKLKLILLSYACDYWHNMYNPKYIDLVLKLHYKAWIRPTPTSHFTPKTNDRLNILAENVELTFLETKFQVDKSEY